VVLIVGVDPVRGLGDQAVGQLACFIGSSALRGTDKRDNTQLFRSEIQKNSLEVTTVY